MCIVPTPRRSKTLSSAGGRGPKAVHWDISIDAALTVVQMKMLHTRDPPVALLCLVITFLYGHTRRVRGRP